MVELLSPAGDRERLEAAIRYGADAVYLGGDLFGMRAGCGNFDADALPEAVGYAHERGVRVYVTCNALPSNGEADALPDFLRRVSGAKPDALIVADIGVMMLARRLVPEIPVHISTQAGIMNYLTATELYKLGASRVVLARELSLADIREIREKTPPGLELEAFVHGAMCMSFSGRCLISSYLTGRDANRGECAQPCRWSYRLSEEKRPGQYFPIVEEDGGSYLLNAQDLCMIGQLDSLIEAGVSSLKIEGRAKSAYYTASVTNAYRGALDAYISAPERYAPPSWVFEEVEKVSHREYSTGFYFGTAEQHHEDGGYIRDWDVIAVVEAWGNGVLTVSERNRFSVGEQVEAMLPRHEPVSLKITGITDPELGCVDTARHPMKIYEIPCAQPLECGTMLRRRTNV